MGKVTFIKVLSRELQTSFGLVFPALYRSPVILSSKRAVIPVLRDNSPETDSISCESNISRPDYYADCSMVDDSLREFAMTLRQSSIKDLKVGHLNVSSLQSMTDEIRLLQHVCKFDILAITESHLDSSVTCLI